MKIAVCAKYFKGELNPFDACALESALRMENAEVTVVAMAPPNAGEPLKQLTRLGVSRAILLTDPAFAGSDTLATSYILSLVLRRLNPDLVLCGRQSIDGDTAQVGSCIAQMLGFSLITNVMEITDCSKNITCKTRAGIETAAFPALLTIERINTLRFASFRSKTNEIEIWNHKDIGADKNRCGLIGSPTKVLKTFENMTPKRNCQFITFDELIPLVDKLRKQEITSIAPAQSGGKLENVWIVGEELRNTALSIAKNITVLQKQSASEIAKLAETHKPEVILWPADLWGRKTAPQAAAILQTGLCADCTHLEADDKKLYMYRPALGGNIMAKIECKTLPQMATVRTTTQPEIDVIVAGGKGAKDCFGKMQEFAKTIGADIGASRGLVDMGLAPYETQIGLTGKTVSPKVYIAIGISGAVQHTCAIEQAGTIIAVNPDKNARIFEYADYGIIGMFSVTIYNSGK